MTISSKKKVKEMPRITFARPDINLNDPNVTQEQINEAIDKCANEMATAILSGKQDRYWSEIHRKMKGR